MDIKERIAALPEWAECEGYEDGLRVDRDTLRLRAALARLALAREWIDCHPHEEWCELYKNEVDQFLVCRCGRDALLKALEVPRG
jgi:hypothetical protein